LLSLSARTIHQAIEQRKQRLVTIGNSKQSRLKVMSKETADMYRIVVVVVVTIVFLGAAKTSIGEQAAKDETREPAAIEHELVTELTVEPVKYRASIKQAMQNHLEATGLIVSMRTPLTQHLSVHTDALRALAGIHGDLYAAGSESPATSPTIWSDAKAFARAIEDLKAKTTELATAAKSSNRHYTYSMLIKTGQSCESCHEAFRLGAD
jgi:cytochrome c556